MVAETIDKTVIRIEADVRKALEEIEKAKKSIGGIGDEADKAGNKTVTAAAAIEAALNSIKIYAAAAAAAIAAIGTKSILAAGDAEEIRNKYEAVFKDMSARSELWAEMFSMTVGRSTLDTLEYLSTFQDTFVPLGFDRAEAALLSEHLTELAVDLASFNNENDTDAIASLQSALVGNHETMRRYGVVITQTTLDQELMNMGIKRGITAATEQEKVMARLNIITNSTADAQGDAARTADSFANQMRALKGNLRDAMAEAGNPAMEDLSVTLKEFNEWGTSGGYDNITTFLSDAAGAAADAAAAVSWLTRSFADLYGTVAPGGLRATPENSTITGTTALMQQNMLDFNKLSDEAFTDVLKQLGYAEDQVLVKLEKRNKALGEGTDIIEGTIDAVNALKEATGSTKFPGWAGQSDYIRERLAAVNEGYDEKEWIRNTSQLMELHTSNPERFYRGTSGGQGTSPNWGSQTVGSIMSGMSGAAVSPTSAPDVSWTTSLVEINRNGFNTLASKLDSGFSGVINAVNNIKISGGGFGGPAPSSDEPEGSVPTAQEVRDYLKTSAAAASNIVAGRNGGSFRVGI